MMLRTLAADFAFGIGLFLGVIKFFDIVGDELNDELKVRMDLVGGTAL